MHCDDHLDTSIATITAKMAVGEDDGRSDSAWQKPAVVNKVLPAL